jgi:outer membrane lipoprotein-sorting protein
VISPLRIGSRVALVAALVAPSSALLVSSRALPSAPANGEEVIRAMHDRYAKSWYRTLSFTQKSTIRTPADTMIVETWKERALLPGHLRIDVERATGNVVVVYSGDSLFVWRGDSVRTRAATRNILLVIGFDVYGQPAETTLAVLEAEHFPMAPMHEETWEGRPVFVIGAAAGDLHSHQLWIDKDRLLFVRSLEPDDRDSTKTVDIRFDNYVKLSGGGWLSERVEIFRDGKLVQREEYSDVRTNIRIDPQIFVPPASH